MDTNRFNGEDGQCLLCILSRLLVVLVYAAGIVDNCENSVEVLCGREVVEMGTGVVLGDRVG